MSAKQFEHFLNLQQRLASLGRPARRTGKTSAKQNRGTSAAVVAAKIWLSETARVR